MHLTHSHKTHRHYRHRRNWSNCRPTMSQLNPTAPQPSHSPTESIGVNGAYDGSFCIHRDHRTGRVHGCCAQECCTPILLRKRSTADRVRYDGASRRDRRRWLGVFRVADSPLDSERALATLADGDEGMVHHLHKLDGAKRTVCYTWPDRKLRMSFCSPLTGRSALRRTAADEVTWRTEWRERESKNSNFKGVIENWDELHWNYADEKRTRRRM
jgi:hypothetical protein